MAATMERTSPHSWACCSNDRIAPVGGKWTHVPQIAPANYDADMIRVILPFHLRTLARITTDEVQLEVAAPATTRAILDALEARYPMLRGTIRDHGTLKRRPFIRFFACQKDLSHDAADTPLPDAIASGAEPFLIVGAIAGG